MKKTVILATCFCLLLGLAAAAAAQDAPATGYLGSFARDYEGATKKLVDLAEATPADKFTWRPTPEVRSISEVYIHVANANFFLSRAVGATMPEGVDREAEKNVTEKSAVIDYLKKSIEHVQQAVAAQAGADLDREVDFFGRKRPARDVFFVIGGHAHEHLGQSIAYARMAGVTPPWSAGGGEG